MTMKPSMLVASLFSTTMMLIGCVQTNAITQSVSNAATETVGGFKTAFEGYAKSNTPKKQKELANAYHMFGWMEDGCIGDSSFDYQKIALLNSQLIENIKAVRDVPIVDPVIDDGYEYYVKPKSQWHPGFARIIDDVNIDVNYEYTEYHFKFKDNVFYRGQPLAEYYYKFRPESEGGQEVLKFTRNADVNSIWPNFKGRQVEDSMDGSLYESKAEYDTKNKTLTCRFD
ncbi:hypothetical protein ACQKC9_04670 [Psychrobacter sp. NPDC078409]|uniref:hypothetical protein n=1 Tax=Psychrobacter sp. NPDC078409 TaxID=3390660 RepID=UPI003D046DDD